MKKHLSPYRCPNCQLTLEKVERVWRCASNHSFDIAKEGYVNLILANKKKSLNSGDDKEMIAARESFLGLGYYDFLVEDLLKLKAFKVKKARFLEIGCGTGFYLDKIAREIAAEAVFGSDVSKEAIRFCAKKYSNYQFSVDNSFDLSFESENFDLILSVFSPFKSSEIERILSKKGSFIVVRAGQGHLKELYELVGIPEKQKEPVQFENLDLVEEHDLKKKIKMTQNALEQLIEMSPLTWKINREKVNLEKIRQITLSFKVSVYKHR